MLEVTAHGEYLGNIVLVKEVRDSIHWPEEIKVDRLPLHFVVLLDREAVVIDRTSRQLSLMKEFFESCKFLFLRCIILCKLQKFAHAENIRGSR
jgi:hypothetical protein